MYEYRARVVRVIDGDTLDVDIDLGLKAWLRDVRIRLAGIDTPELHGPDSEKAKEARDFLDHEVGGGNVTLRTRKPDPADKYGRWLAEVIPAGQTRSVNERLVEAGLAKRYDGGKRQ